MARIGLWILGLWLVLFGCSNSSQKKEEGGATVEIVPQADIKVSKEYDKNGNLIRYDSAYSWYYSNVKGNKYLHDSIMKNFREMFNRRYFFSEHPYFRHLFFQDSLLQYDFYKKDFFLSRFRNNMNCMEKLFEEMDSLKNQYFGAQSRALKP